MDPDYPARIKEEVEGKERICRLCACSTQLIIPIFDGEGLENNLPEKFDKHLPIQIAPHDTLPVQVCFQCASTVLSWHELTMTCVKAEKKLIAMFGANQVLSTDPQLSPADSRGDDAVICDDSITSLKEQENVGIQPETVEIMHEPESLIEDQDIREEGVHSSEPQEGDHTRLKSGGQMSFTEYHAYRNKTPSFGFSKGYPQSAFQDCSASSLKEGKRHDTKSRNELFESYQENSSSSLSDSSDSSDDSYVPPKKLKAMPTRKQTRSRKTKNEETSDVPVVGKQLHCVMCSRSFKRSYDLSRHVKAQHFKVKSEPEDTTSFGVDESSNAETSAIAALLPNHLPADQHNVQIVMQNASAAEVTCNNCNRKFRTKDALQRHVTGDRCIMNPPLDTCAVEVEVKEEEQMNEFDDMKDSDYSESSADSFKMDKDIIHPGPSKEKPVYKCEVCNKQFKLKESYTTHTRIHTGEKPFTCHMCGKQFSHSGGLSYHLRHVHLGIKEHPCDICGRKFALKAAMQDHRRIHTGERPYVCDVCGKSFKSKASLYIHGKTHTDQFPHPCEYCTKRFRWRQQLLGHITTHTGEKKHHCKICNKGFGVRNDLTRHERIHSGQKPFKCSVCGLAFGQKRYLKNHLKSRHGILRMENVEASQN